MFQGCFEGILRVLQGSFNSVEEVLRKFQGRFRKVTWMRMGSFQGVSKKFQWCFEEVSRAFH